MPHEADRDAGALGDAVVVDGFGAAFAMLRHCSATFHAYIDGLPPGTKNAVCVMYLLLRALDTFEDDPTLGEPSERALLCQRFAELIRHTTDVELSYDTSLPRYEPLMRRLGEVAVAPLLALPPAQAETVRRSVTQMGDGMADALRRHPRWFDTVTEFCDYACTVAYDVSVHIRDVASFDVDCRALNDARRQAVDVSSRELSIAIQMTNVIMDVAEDVRDQARCYWPRELFPAGALDLGDAAACPRAVFEAADPGLLLVAQNRFIVEALVHIARMFTAVRTELERPDEDPLLPPEEEQKGEGGTGADVDERTAWLAHGAPFTGATMHELLNKTLMLLCSMHGNRRVVEGGYAPCRDECARIRRASLEWCQTRHPDATGVIEVKAHLRELLTTLREAGEPRLHELAPLFEFDEKVASTLRTPLL